MSMLFSAQEIRRSYQLFLGKQAISMALSLGSAVLIARQIGPASYGAYFICITFIEYLVQGCQFGMGPFLYREKAERFQDSLNSYFAFTLTLSLLVSSLIFGGLFLFGYRDPSIVSAAKWLIFSVPLLLVNNALRLSLEKELKSKVIAASEILAHGAFLLTGSCLAFSQLGLWAPVTAWWVQNLVLFASLFWWCAVRPEFQLSKSRLDSMLKSGAPIVGVSLISGLEAIALGVVTAARLGITSTGELGLVRKIISRVSVLQVPNTRLSNIVCGNHVADRERLKRFVEVNLIGNTLSFGLLFLTLSWVPNFLFVKVLGSDWGSSYTLLPWLSLASFTSSSFYVLQAALISLEAHRIRFLFAVAFLVVLVAASTLLMPRFGIRGWAMGEAAASLLFPLLPLAVEKHLGPFEWKKPLSLWLFFGLLITLRTFS